MAHPQNSPRGLWDKTIKFPVVATKPATRIAPGTVKVVSNSTGVGFVMNTTGTTWEYINTTSVQA